jgi:tetratricopeptide (TPR) repeat protein
MIALLLARHFEEAGLAEKAIRYLHLAAEQAMRISANTEAIGHLTRALSLLQTVPATVERDQLELRLQVGLGTATIVAYGWSALGVRTALDRARDLCRAAETAHSIVPVLRGLYTHYHALAEHQTAYELAQQLYALAQEDKDPAHLLMAHHALGQSQVEMGHAVAARDTLETGLAYHDPEQYRILAYTYGEEHGISSRCHLAFCLLALGYPDQALLPLQEALALAEELGHPHILAYTLCGLGAVHLLRRDSQQAQRSSESAIDICVEKGIPFWQAMATINHGHGLSMQGRTGEGIGEATQGLLAYRAIGASVLQTLYLAQLADMHLMAGQVDAGLARVSEGLAAASETDERCVEAELYRLRGELLRRQGDETEAEADWHRALAVARQQQARLWELRATMSLCRLWRDQGKRAKAREMLADIYGWFTEGFNTLDLQEVKALLAELADL